jgi:Calcineurin-like phosphoesterase
MHRSVVVNRLAVALWLAALSGCGALDEQQQREGEVDDGGSVQLLLAQTPSDAACLQVSFAGSRTVTASFDLAPSAGTQLVAHGLPVGAVRVDARAFAERCSRVKTDDAPRWVLAQPVTTRIDGLTATKLRLRLVRNGRSELTVDFEPPPWLSQSKTPVELAIIGDTPYGAAQIEDFPSLLADIQADSRIAMAVHVGDIKNGSSRCDDDYFQQIFAAFSTLDIPLVFTPGDNEWTDCHRQSNGAYDPLERLDALRRLFFATPGLALGGGFKQVMVQADEPGFETFVENQIWFDAAVAFGTVHVVGSNDSKPPWYTDDPTGTKVDEPARRDSERAERSAATLAWLDRLFDLASEQQAAGVAIMMQADTFDAFSVANGLPLDSFSVIVRRIASRARAFAKPVLLLQGDSHLFIADRPLANGSSLHGVTESVPNLTRIVVQGSTTKPLTEWLRLRVDPAAPEVFTWERNAR